MKNIPFKRPDGSQFDVDPAGVDHLLHLGQNKPVPISQAQPPNLPAHGQDLRPVAGDAAADSASVAAIQFALRADDGLTFLRLWNEGEFASCREEWPEAGEECYRGADPLMKLVHLREPPVRDIAEKIVAKWELLGKDHGQAVEAISSALERERSRAGA